MLAAVFVYSSRGYKHWFVLSATVSSKFPFWWFSPPCRYAIVSFNDRLFTVFSKFFTGYKTFTVFQPIETGVKGSEFHVAQVKFP